MQRTDLYGQVHGGLRAELLEAAADAATTVGAKRASAESRPPRAPNRA